MGDAMSFHKFYQATYSRLTFPNPRIYFLRLHVLPQVLPGDLLPTHSPQPTELLLPRVLPYPSYPRGVSFHTHRTRAARRTCAAASRAWSLAARTNDLTPPGDSTPSPRAIYAHRERAIQDAHHARPRTPRPPPPRGHGVAYVVIIIVAPRAASARRAQNSVRL